MYNEGLRTFLTGEALAEKRRVKIKAGTVTTPAEVEYADAGEDFIGVTEFAVSELAAPITVKFQNAPGTFEIECTVGAAIVRGTVLYGAADGKISDTAVGSGAGISLEAGVTGQQIEVALWNVKSTTAATVSVLDALGIITGGTVEAALAELMVGAKTTQYTLMPDQIRLEDGTPVPIFAGAGADGWTQLAGKVLALRWNDGGTPTDIAMQFVMPQDLDDGADMILHLMGAIVKAGGAEVDSPVFTVEAYFDVPGAAPGAGANVGGDSGEFLTAATNTLQEKTLTIALADVPASPSVLTLILHPKDGQLGTDDFVLLTPWLEVKRKCLTV
jgi:hypothetical protein